MRRNFVKCIFQFFEGMIFVSVTIFLASFPMFAFPRRLAKKRKSVAPNDKLKAASQSEHVVQQATKHKNPSLKDFPKAVKRLLKNDILVFRTASSVLHILPIAGLYTFLPKYLESQFRLTAHHANMISGSSPLFLSYMLSYLLLSWVCRDRRDFSGRFRDILQWSVYSHNETEPEIRRSVDCTDGSAIRHRYVQPTQSSAVNFSFYKIHHHIQEWPY